MFHQVFQCLQYLLGKDFMKKNCASLKEHAMKIIIFRKKKMNLLKKELQE